MSTYRFVATSETVLARAARDVYRRSQRVGMPAPRVATRLALAAFIVLRAVYHWLVRVVVCEPLFKAYCTSYGRRLRTGVFVHWVQGAGEIVVGDDVTVDGKCSFTFAARFAARPRLTIGDCTVIGHNTAITVGKRVTIGRGCLIANDVRIFDSSGHPSDPARRRAGAPPAADEVRPVTIGDNVWIGRGAALFPGVTVGDDSVISAYAVVMSDVPPGVIVAGNPARKIAMLREAAAATARE